MRSNAGMILAAGALLGLVSVALGAWAAHGLKGSVSAEALGSFMTAIRYNQFHAVVIVAIGLALRRPAAPGDGMLALSAWLFVAGTLLFSVAIYAAVLADAPALNRAAPFGGTALMAGWVVLAWAGLRFRKSG